MPDLRSTIYDDTTKTFKGNLNGMSFVVGDNNEISKFKPHLIFKPWDEYNIVLEPDGKLLTLINKNLISPTNENVKIDNNVCGMEWIKFSETELKWYIIFKSKPKFNSYTMKLGGDWEQFNWIYQTPLEEEANTFGGRTEEFELDGDSYIKLYDRNNNEVAYRPKNIDGSYAVYHKTKSNHIIGQTDYQTGKFLHIPVPKVTDSSGSSELCVLNISNGIYTVTIPQVFLNKAKYPITINDSYYGYSSKGVSSRIIYNNRVYAAQPSTNPTSDGTITSLHLWGTYTSGHHYYGVIYNDDSGSPASRIGVSASPVDGNASGTALELEMPLSGSVSSGQKTWLGWCGDGAVRWYLRYDNSGAGNSLVYDTDTGYAQPPDPWPGTNGTEAITANWSIWAVYEEGGSPPTGGRLIGPRALYHYRSRRN